MWRLWLAVVAGAKEGGADPYPGCALSDGGFQVVAHAHGKGVERQVQLVLQRAHSRKGSGLFSLIFGGLGNRHQATQLQARQGADGSGQCWQILWRTA